MHKRARKPFAVRRLQLRRRYFQTMDPEIQAIYRPRHAYDKYGRMRSWILRPGRFFYCQDCGKRIDATSAVIELGDDTFVSCLDCAINAGLDVWTRERMGRRLLGRSFADDGIRYYQ